MSQPSNPTGPNWQQAMQRGTAGTVMQAKASVNLERETKRMNRAVMQFVFNQPFFAFLLMRLIRKSSSEYPALATDGRSLWWNPEYTSGITDAEIQGALAHVIMHCANGHPWRGAGRDEDAWNESCDLAINPLLEQSRFALPDDHHTDPRFTNASAEQIYLVKLEERLQNPPGGGKQPNGGAGGGQAGQNQNSQGNQPQGNQPGCGQVVTPKGGQADLSKLETDWTLAVEQAYQYAKGRGVLPSGAELLVQNMKKPVINWRAELRRLMQDRARSDYSWSRPNPRYTSMGLYLPDVRSEQLGEIVIALDTSGSTYHRVEEFVAEVNDILTEVKPARVHVLHVDAAVHHVDVFERGDSITGEYNLHGGGGTAFEPAFEYADKLDEPPVCLLYLTDLWGSFPDVPPAYPVIWAATTDVTPPFGDVVPLNWEVSS